MRRILLTGRPGVGKSTLVREVAQRADPLAGGILTEEMREGKRRVGFHVIDVSTDERAVLAHADRRDGPKVGQYRVDVPSFERSGVAALDRAAEREGLIVVDEIGKMELFSEGFRSAVERIFASSQPVLATVPLRRPPFVAELERRASAVREVTRANRDQLAESLLRELGFRG